MNFKVAGERGGGGGEGEVQMLSFSNFSLRGPRGSESHTALWAVPGFKAVPAV